MTKYLSSAQMYLKLLKMKILFVCVSYDVATMAKF